MEFKTVTLVIFSVLNLATLVQSLCEDLNADACSSLQKLMPEMCQDMCIAEVCRRTCNICPLQCYSCPQTFYPEECKQTKECTGSEVCVAVQELSVDFLPLYYSDCMSKLTCLEVFGGINTGVNGKAQLLQKRDYALNGSCCDHDFCNLHDPQKTPTEPPNVQIRPTPPTKDYGVTCNENDKNKTVCDLIMAADPDMCKKQCFAQEICPSTCQTCNRCYQCVDVKDPSECKRSRLCNVGQHCIEIHTLDDTFSPTYKLGCAADRICKLYFGGVNLSPSVVAMPGKRQIGTEGLCCDKPFCNGPAPQSTTPITTPNLTTRGPTGLTIAVSITMDATTAAATATQPVTATASGKPQPTATKMTPLPTTKDTTQPSMPITAVTNPASTAMPTNPPSTTMAPTTTTTAPFVEVTLKPDPRCPDESSRCQEATQSILCDMKNSNSRDYAIHQCASTCNLCDEYFKWKNATASITTAQPCVDNPSAQCFSLFCLDTTPRGREYVKNNCAKFCGACS